MTKAFSPVLTAIIPLFFISSCEASAYAQATAPKSESPSKTMLNPPQPSQSPETTVYKIVPWVLVALGAGAVVGGGVCTGLAASEYDDYRKVPWDDPNKNSKKSSIETKNTASYVLYGVGGAMIAGGLIWFFVADSQAKKAEKSEPNKAQVEFIPAFAGLYGGTVSVRW